MTVQRSRRTFEKSPLLSTSDPGVSIVAALLLRASAPPGQDQIQGHHRIFRALNASAA